MARVTVEDCIQHIPNRFELVVMAAHRAKQISSGSQLTVDRDNDKDAVVSLREIGDKTIDLPSLNGEIIQSFRKRQMVERIAKPSDKDSTEIEEMLAEESGQPAENDEEVAKHLSIGVQGKSGLSFETDNIEVED